MQMEEDYVAILEHKNVLVLRIYLSDRTIYAHWLLL